MPLLLGVLMMATSSPAIVAQNHWLSELHACENPKNIPWIIDSNGKKSLGYLEFQMDTWLSYGKKYGATKENIYENNLQIKVAESMLDKGLWRNWRTCYKRTVRKYGAYPIDSK